MSVLQLVNGIQRTIASTAFGRGLLNLADAAALRTTAGLPTDSPAIDLNLYPDTTPYTEFTYSGGNLTQIQVFTQQGGGLLKTTTLTYTAGNLTQIVVTDGTVTRTKTIAYSGGNISAITGS